MLVAATACAGGAPTPPTVLSDGSAARPPPIALEGVEGPSILTRARVRPRDRVETGSQTARCLDAARASATAVVVERVGVSGTSVTVFGPRNHTVYGCDASGISAMADTPWCGHAFGRLDAGRLSDPRLSLTCRSGNDDPLGFAWIQPDAAASYLVVRRQGYSEVYPVGGRAPVRIITDDVDQDSVSATFSVGEHAPDGRRLSAYEVEARVSG
jgi:hypothetical protein